MDTFIDTEKYGIVYNESSTLNFQPSKYQSKSQILYHFAHFYLCQYIINLILGTIPTSLLAKYLFSHTFCYGNLPFNKMPWSLTLAMFILCLSLHFSYPSPSKPIHSISRISFKCLSFFPYLLPQLKPTWLLA